MGPLWEWNSTIITVVSFVCQDLVRGVVIIAAALALAAIKRHTIANSPESHQAKLVRTRINVLFQVLVSLIFLEVLEMCVKFFEVQTVCDAPYVTMMREKRFNASHPR